ncbi:SGNH/GDSL hydrolase family protein, partial [Bacillus sp. TL12]|uniref:SGNH/GDSL hydrolase family protein n=1 Tax=Bacillus sp. TL12 TaxID=2894756 RepID=UPI001F523955
YNFLLAPLNLNKTLQQNRIFLSYYRKMIERELDWGSAVILLTPPKNRYDVNPDSYENAVILLGKEYGIPVVRTDEMIAGYSPEIYSDGTHFNGKGYTIWASRIAALFIGKGPEQQRKVLSGTTLLGRDYVDNVVLSGNAILRSTNGYPTPNEIEVGKGIAALIGPGDKATWSFYLETDDMILLPTASMSQNDSKLKLTLDFGVQQADVPIDYLYGTGAVHDKFLPSSIEWTYPPDFRGSSVSPAYYQWTQPRMVIAQKGWHTITAEYVGTDTVAVSGLSFYSYHNFMKIKLLENRKNSIKLKTHAAYTETTDVKSTSIKLQDIIDMLGYPTPSSYWENPPIKVTVQNWDANVLEYVVMVGNRSTGTKFSVGLDVKETKLVSSPATDKIRTLASISFDSASDMLTFNWSGATTRATTYTITLF